VSDVLLYLAAAALAGWGGVHLVKTGPVMAGFEPMPTDHRRVFTMEWITEGLALLFIAALAVAIAAGEPTSTGRVVLWISVVMLNVMSAVSLGTGARVDFIAYRLCPVIFAGASLLIVWSLLA
jgi:hypothetical protein